MYSVYSFGSIIDDLVDFQVYPARTLAFRFDSVLPRARAFPSWSFVLFMEAIVELEPVENREFPGSVTVIDQKCRTISFKLIQPWQFRDQFAVQIQLAVLISVSRSSSCGPT